MENSNKKSAGKKRAALAGRLLLTLVFLGTIGSAIGSSGMRLTSLIRDGILTPGSMLFNLLAL
jgi:hypothetical protein